MKFRDSNASGSSGVLSVEVSDQIWGMNILHRFPRVVFYSKVFPLYQVPKFPIDHLTVQDFLNHPFLFSFYDFWDWRRWDASASDWVIGRRGQFDDIEDRVKAFHREGEAKVVCIVTNFSFDWERAEVTV